MTRRDQQMARRGRALRTSLVPPSESRFRATVLVALGLLTGCSALGNEAPFSDIVSTSGVGPYRRLGTNETRLRGAALNLGNVAVDRVAYATGSLFYGAAAPLDPLPERDAALPLRDIDPGQLEPRRIFRTTGESVLAFDPGTVVLTASEAWEGDYVTQPFVFEMPDGSARLYYSAAGGIGLASAPSVEGVFTRVGDGLVLANDAAPFAGGLRSPAVGFLHGTYYLYADDGTDTWVATSVDGVSFTVLDADPVAPGTNPLVIPDPADEGDLAERAHVSPAVVVATSPTGRTTLRLYLEAQQIPEDGGTADHRIILALASIDGATFERARLPAHEANDGPGQPAMRPYDEDEADNLMYLTVSRGMSVQLRAVVLAVDPGRANFVPEPEEEAAP